MERKSKKGKVLALALCGIAALGIAALGIAGALLFRSGKDMNKEYITQIDHALTSGDFLKADGKLLRNARGEQVQLRGTNIGGYLLREFWMSPVTKALEVRDEITMVLSLAACAGSGSNGNNSNNDVNNDNNGSGIGYELDENTPAWQLDKRENTKLTWYVNADWWNKSWNEDVVTRQMKKDLNLDIEFLTGDDTVLNGLVAGGEYPDIITVFGNTSDLALRANQWAYSLQELADTYDPYFYKVARQESLDWFQLSDGKTYGYPNYSNTQEDYDSGDMYITDAFVIREDVYEALGRPSMKTQEEFLDVLNQIKEKYPDLVPLGFNDLGTGTGSLGDKLQDMLGVPLANEDNSFYDRNLDEDYLSWLRTLRQAHENGCISDDSFSDDGTLFQEKITIGKYACIIMSGISQQSGFLTTFTNNTGVSYIAIDGPRVPWAVSPP